MLTSLHTDTNECSQLAVAHVLSVYARGTRYHASQAQCRSDCLGRSDCGGFEYVVSFSPLASLDRVDEMCEFVAMVASPLRQRLRPHTVNCAGHFASSA